MWQTAICLPDDWQKTLVARDGALLYDFPGKIGGFGLRLRADLPGSTWIRQELESPRLPIVRTVRRAGTIEMIEETFAVPPPLPIPRSAKAKPAFIERIGQNSRLTGWANPSPDCDAMFRDTAVGWNQPIQYHVKASAKDLFTIVLGFCEGWHTNAGQRVMELRIEGKPRRTTDLFAEKGRNVPALFALDARDENGDGWIDVEVAAAAGSVDKNTILNALWVFRESDAPLLAQLEKGRPTQPPYASVACGTDTSGGYPARNDVVVVRLRNLGDSSAAAKPILAIETESPIRPDEARSRIDVGDSTTLFPSRRWAEITADGKTQTVRFGEILIPPKGEAELSIVVARGRDRVAHPAGPAQVRKARKSAEAFWRKADLPYDRIQVPDPGLQAQLDSAIRNIYQAREIKQGLPAFQVGPTVYRGLWVVDGSFILEAVTFLGRAGEARNGVKYLMSFQRPDGGFMLIDGHWKETGIALWAIARHARLTGDPKWLHRVWPQVRRGVDYIRVMRQMSSRNPAAPNAGLIPDGFSDGGLADQVPEYTNIYWTLAGLRAAVEAARWLEESADADAWQREYDDFNAAFRRAAERDLRTDSRGNRFLPIRMTDNASTPPQKAQWAFLHAVFPGKVFERDDPLVTGNMAMLRAVEEEGLVLDTGWLKNGLWNYFGSFYGHAWLWLGDGGKAVETLYAFANHASPLLAWREEHMPLGQGGQFVGDMPHNWASAEFIRLVRHCIALERGGELHLFEGVPASWMRPGAVIRFKEVATEFGPLSFEFRVARDGATAELRLEPPTRALPEQIVLHTRAWSGGIRTIGLPIRGLVRAKFNLGVGRQR